MNYRLYPQQKRALITPAQEILYGGALGGGKSYLARVAAIVYSVEIPGLMTYLFRRTFKEVLSNHVHTPGGLLEMLQPLIDTKGCTYNKSDFSVTFSNGSRIQLAHCQYENDVYQYQGAQIGFLILDETTHFSEMMIRFLRSRLRLGSLSIGGRWAELFPRILYVTNPGGTSHNYIKGGFVDHGCGSTFRADISDGGMLREYIPAKLSDNKVLLQNDPRYAERVMGLGDSPLVQAMLDGDWDIIAGGAFSDIWNPKVHVVPPFDIPHTWKIDRCFDYGASAPGANLWVAESDGTSYIDGHVEERCDVKGSLFIVGELYFADRQRKGLNLSPREQADRIYRYEMDEGFRNRVAPGPADNSIFNRDPGSKSIADQMADGDITYTRSDKTPGSRIAGVAIMRQMLSSTSNVNSDLPGLRVFSDCFHTIRTVPALQRDDRHIEDVDTNGEDHIWDALRYRLLKASRTVKFKRVIGF